MFEFLFSLHYYGPDHFCKTLTFSHYDDAISEFKRLRKDTSLYGFYLTKQEVLYLDKHYGDS